jgi:HK97 family phage major capsid protein
MGATALSPGIVLMAAPSIEDLQAEITALQEEAAGLVTAADEAGEDLTDDQVERIDAIDTEIQAKTKQITARQKAARVVPSAGRKSTPEPTNGGGDRTVPAAPRTVNPRGGFESFGQFAVAVRNMRRADIQPDARLLAAATTYGTEGVGADGGFLVPPEFSRTIWEKVMAEENLANRCAPLQTGSNNMRIPKDETTPWQTSGGVQVYWEGEAGTIAQSKPAFEFSDLRLVKLTALVPVSDELLEDAVGIESWLRAKAPAKMAAKINTAIVRGNGVGQPLGILDAGNGGLITVDPNISQPADTVWFENVSDMWARMYAPWRRNSVWLINQDIESQLDQMAFDPQATSKVPVYLPSGGLSASPYATLKGRPVVPIEACSTLGDVGDIILVDLMQYWMLTKAAGMRTDTSIHLYFDQALTTFRFIFRLNGQPAWKSTIAPENGTMTRSWAVTLGARS